MIGKDHEVESKKTFKVWDIWVRLFHWLLVILILLSYLTAEIGGFDFTVPGTGYFVSTMNLHVWSGLAILGLLIFRLIWGFIGSSSARFTNFLRSPRAILGYLRATFRGPVPFFAGHNPAGGAAVAIILLVLTIQATTGLFAQDDSFFATKGPLAYVVGDETSKKITGIHKQWWEYVVVVVIAIHLAANLFYWLIKKQDLITAMFTGKRRLPDSQAPPHVSMKTNWHGAAVAIIAGITIWLIISF